eukprot:s36_g22.t1
MLSCAADRHANHRRAGHTAQRSHPDEGRRPPGNKERWNDSEHGAAPEARVLPPPGRRQAAAGRGNEDRRVPIQMATLARMMTASRQFG